MAQHHLIDGIYFCRHKKKKNKKYWRLFILIPILVSFFFVGEISAAYVLPKLDFVRLFRDGRYLVLLQNNAELRSSGGFIGSYAVVAIKNFEVQNISFNTNIYALDNAFAQRAKVLPPTPMTKMLNGQTWALRDSNYDASFFDAAQDTMFFYEQETGDKIDGVIGVNAGLIVDLLKMTGPIKLEKSNVTIAADNFYLETQSQIERIYYQNPENWVLNEPKSFLQEMYPAILAQALKDQIQFLSLIKKELRTKEIIFYFQDPIKQALVQKYNLAGAVPTDQELKDIFKTDKAVDHLYLNSNSYSGNKSSLSIRDDLNYKLTETSDLGPKMYRAELKISRIHSGSYDWPDGKNIEWLRIFVPAESQFLQVTINGRDISSNVDVGIDAGKIYFGTEVTTEPGQANIIEINYLIPYESDYHLLVQKQPGRTTNLNVNVSSKMLFDGILDRDQKIQKD